MKKRYRQQQTVESDRTPYPYQRSPQQARAPRETGGVRWTIVLCVSILGLLLIGAVVLGILSVADVIHGHPGATWLHFTEWLQANLWWLIGGPLVALVVFKIVLPVHETRAHTAVERAEAARIREETRHLREARYHNEDNMPDGYIALPNTLGNYSQVIPDGQIPTYLFPGNSPDGSGVNPKLLLDVMERLQQQVIDADDQLQIEGPEIDADTVEAPTFAEEVEDGSMQPGQPFVFAYAVVTNPYTHVTALEPITDAQKHTIFLAGWSGTGKSTLVACAMARRARMEQRVAYLVLDPHKGAEEDSLTVQILPAFDEWLIQPKGGEKVTGKRPVEVRAAVQFLKNEVELRLRRPDLTKEQKRQMSPYFDLSIWVIIDECLSYARETRLAKHDPVYDELLALMQEIATDGRKVGITGVYMTQLTTKDELGAFEIKDACPRRVVLSVPRDQGKALGLTGPEAAIAERFPQGRGYYKTKAGMQMFVWGFGSPADIANALQGIPSPLIPEWKQTRNKIVTLVSRQTQFPSEEGGEMSLKEEGNEMRNEFPAALQAELEKIPDWQGKLELLTELIGGDRREIWQALFGKAPGGNSNAKEVSIYNVLLEAYRYRYRQMRQVGETS